MLKTLQSKTTLLSASDVRNFESSKPSEIEKAILDFNKYAETLQDLYDITEDVSSKVNIKDVEDVLSYHVFPITKAQAKKEEKVESEFSDYKKDMHKIEENGRKKMTALKLFAAHPFQYGKEKTLTKDYFSRGVSKNYGIGEEYVNWGTDASGNLSIFRDCLEDSNKTQFLIINYQLNENIEALKQLRDKKIAAKTKGDAESDSKDHIYSYGNHQSFVSAGKIDDSIAEADVEINSARKGLKQEKISKTVKSELKQKKADAKEKKAHLLHIQAEEELSQRFAEKKIGELLNQRIILAYLSFDPEQFRKALKRGCGNVEDATRESNTRVRANEVSRLMESNPESRLYKNDADTNSHFVKDFAANNKSSIPNWISSAINAFMTKVIPFFTKKGIFGSIEADENLLEAMGKELKESDILKMGKNTSLDGMTATELDVTKHTKLDRKGSDLVIGKSKDKDGTIIDKTVSQKDLSSQFALSGGLGLLKAACGTVSQIFKWIQIGAANEEIRALEEKGMMEDAALKRFEQICDIIRSLVSLVDTLSAYAKAGVDIATAAGKLTLEGAATAAKVFQIAGGVTSLITGGVDTALGVRKTVKAHQAVKAADKSRDELTNITGADTSQASRFLHRVKISEEQNRTEGFVDTASGAAKVAGAIASLIPGGATVGTVLGVAASAASFVAKQVISKCFNKKRTNAAWEEVLGYSHEEYKGLLSRMGGKSDQRFHDVLRRKTGIATRTDYSEALAVTDAVDLYTAARAYPIINAGKLENPDDNAQKVIKTTLSGMQFSKPEKYGNIELKDIMEKAKIDGDWRGTLKQAITKNARFNIKEDMGMSMANDVLSGKYD